MSWSAHYVPVGAPGPPGGSAQGLAVDSSGNIFVAAGESSGQEQTCVFKLDPQGNLRAQVCFVNSGFATVAVGPDGNPVIAGTTYSPDSLKLVSPLVQQTGIQEAGYVIKFKSDLSGIIFSTLVGGTKAGSSGAGTTVSALAVDQAGNIYIGGWTLDGDFPVTTGAFQTEAPARAAPVFVTAISSAGDKILWSTFLGGPNPCTNCNLGSADVYAIAVDPAGAVVIAGSATGEQMPVTAGVIGPTCLCTTNQPAPFLAKLTSGGSALAWATYVNYAGVSALALDAGGNVIIGGQASTGFTATSGALQPAYPGVSQTPSGNAGYNSAAGFVAKIDPSATNYLFATYLGGNNFQRFISSYEIFSGANGVAGMALDAKGTIWVTGGSVPSELPLPGSIPVLGTNYILGLSPDGTTVTAASTVPEGGAALGIAISPQGPVALGRSGSTLIPVPAMPALAGIANAAGLSASGSVSPNEIISLYGEGLGPSPALSGQIVDGVLTTSLGGVQVRFDGVAAPLLYAGPNQINAVVPSGVAGRPSTTLNIATPTGQIAGIVLSVANSIPEVVTYPPPGNAALALNEDGTPNSATNPAAQGSVVSVWATGGGTSGNPEADGAITGSTVYPLPFPLSVGTGIPNAVPTAPVLNPVPTPQVQYSGDAPDMVKGVIQVNFQIPQLNASSAGAFGFFLQVGSAYSDPFTVYVQ